MTEGKDLMTQINEDLIHLKTLCEAGALAMDTLGEVLATLILPANEVHMSAHLSHQVQVWVHRYERIKRSVK